MLRSGNNQWEATQSNLKKYDIHPKEQLPSGDTLPWRTWRTANRVRSGRVIFFSLVPGSGSFQLSGLAGLVYGLGLPCCTPVRLDPLQCTAGAAAATA